MLRAQRHVAALIDIIVDRAELLHDALIGPALEGPAEIAADELAEHASIDALRVIMRNCRHLFTPISSSLARRSDRRACHDLEFQLMAPAWRLEPAWLQPPDQRLGRKRAEIELRLPHGGQPE